MPTKLKELSPVISIAIAALAFFVSAAQYQIAIRNKDIAFKTILYTSQIDAATELMTQADLFSVKLTTEVDLALAIIKRLQPGLDDQPPPPPPMATAPAPRSVARLSRRPSNRNQQLPQPSIAYVDDDLAEMLRRIDKTINEVETKIPYKLTDAVVVFTRLKHRCSILFPAGFFGGAFDESDDKLSSAVGLLEDLQFDLSSIQYGSREELKDKLGQVIEKFGKRCLDAQTSLKSMKNEIENLDKRVRSFINSQQYIAG